MKKIVFTSLDDFKSPKAEVKSYTTLHNDFVEWIIDRFTKNYQCRSFAELKAGEELKRNYSVVHEQPYFNINGRSYFLDYYLPSLRVAVEIDGKQHENRKIEDKLRDNDFLGIGIRTIRVSAHDVMSGKLMECMRVWFKKSVRPGKRKDKKKKTVLVGHKTPNLIKSAYKRLREHERMKHKSTWI